MEDRLIDVETKISHQEILIERLEKVVYEQQLAIDRLQSLLKDFMEKQGAGGIGPANEKPPHY